MELQVEISDSAEYSVQFSAESVPSRGRDALGQLRRCDARARRAPVPVENHEHLTCAKTIIVLVLRTNFSARCVPSVNTGRT